MEKLHRRKKHTECIENIIEMMDIAFPFDKDFDQNYQFFEMLGKGSFAKVWKIKDNNNNILAIKIIDPHVSDLDKKRFIDEYTMMNSINHPNIIKCFKKCSFKTILPINDVNTYCTFYGIIMEYHKSKNLEDYLNENKSIPLPKIILIFNQMIQIILYLHTNNIIHRDIKLSNFLLSFDEDVLKLTDFGLSLQYHNLKIDPGRYIGTPLYMSPEYILNEITIVDQFYANDIWALGVCFYQLLCQQYPYDAMSLKDLRNKLSLKKYKIPNYENYPDIRVKFCIWGCLLYESNNRWTASKLSHFWNTSKILPKEEENECA
jgi:serine/threonine protein kinase